MATKIIMYTGNSCSKCMRAKAMLDDLPSHIRENVELVEINVDENESERLMLTEVIKSNTLPTILIPKNSESYWKNKEEFHIFRGFDENIGKIMEVLGL
ncbi:glutaredoxin family protein [Bacillus pseudomycoides]|uniref:glutaredoxin family protein n=1 Tax=Bacillus pseudomycoides TaxID=64104 RepID=UPI003CF4F715